MALVAKTIPFSLSVTLRDGLGRKATLAYLMTAALYADAVTDAATVLAALAAVTDAEIDAYEISSRFYENAPANPAITVQNREKASLTLALTEDAKYANVQIPAPNAGIFTTDPNVVDTADLALTAFTDLFTNELYVSDGEVATGVVNGRRTSVAVGKTGQR
jgi:hypothetical protein